MTQTLSRFSLYIPDEETGREVKRIADAAGINSTDLSFEKGYVYHKDVDTKYFFYHVNRDTDYPYITLSQFKEMFEGKREVKEYAIMSQVFKDAFMDLMNWNQWNGMLTIGTKAYDRVVELNLLETWFTPVFKEEEKTVSCGGEKFTITKDRYENYKGITFTSEDIYRPFNILSNLFPETTTLAEIQTLLNELM